MDSNLDLSSVVSLIMSHPELIEEIASLAKREMPKMPSSPSESKGTEPPSEEGEREQETVQTASEVVEVGGDGKRENRKKLFSAIRPFLSEERARTLSSVEAVISILDSLHS